MKKLIQKCILYQVFCLPQNEAVSSTLVIVIISGQDKWVGKRFSEPAKSLKNGKRQTAYVNGELTKSMSGAPKVPKTLKPRVKKIPFKFRPNGWRDLYSFLHVKHAVNRTAAKSTCSQFFELHNIAVI